MLFLNRFNGLGALAAVGGGGAVITDATWRINVTLNNQGSYSAVAITDVIYRDIDGASISTGGGTASASAVAGSNTAAKAFDGTGTTNWASTTALPQWLQMAYSGDVTPYFVDIQGNNTSPDQAVNAIRDFDLQYGAGPTTVLSYEQQHTWATGEWRRYLLQDGADTDWASVTLLIPGEGVSASTNIKDISDNGLWLTVNGNTSITTSNPPSGIATSLAFDGTGDYLGDAADAAYGFGTGDFTIELFIYHIAGAADWPMLDFRTAGSTNGMFYLTTGTKLTYYNGTVYGNTGTSITTATWHHIEFSRVSGTLYAFLDGNLEWSAAMAGDFGSTRPLKIGSNYVPSSYANGQFSQIRITKGVGRHTSTFTAPTAPLPFNANPVRSSLFDYDNLTPGGATLDDDNMTIVSAGTNFYGSRTLATYTGKYYCECQSPAITSGNILVGIAGSGWSAATALTSALTYYAQIPGLYSSGTLVSGWTAVGANGIIGIAFDTAATTLWISIDGVWQSGDPGAGTGGYNYSALITGAVCIVGCMYTTGQRVRFNLGQSNMVHTIPTGFTSTG